MGCLCEEKKFKCTFFHLLKDLKYKCIKDDNLENNILAWKNEKTLETNLSSKNLKIIFESNLDNYNYYTNNFLNSKNNNYILSYKLSSQNIDSMPISEISNQFNSNEFKKIGIIYWIKRELEEKSQYEKTIQEIKIQYNNNKYETYIGVLNHNLEGIKKVHNILNENGLKLFAVKCDYNLVKVQGEPFPELDYCVKNKINFFSCDVFEKGILSGKYNSDNYIPEKNNEEWRVHYNNQIYKIEKINDIMKKNNYKADISQIPIAYNISKGTIPVIDFDELNEFLNNREAIEGSNIELSKAQAVMLKRTIDQVEIEVFKK